MQIETDQSNDGRARKERADSEFDDDDEQRLRKRIIERQGTGPNEVDRRESNAERQVVQLLNSGNWEERRLGRRSPIHWNAVKRYYTKEAEKR